jgi:hypothetical protein
MRSSSSCSAPELAGVTGRYFRKWQEERSSGASYDTGVQSRLWAVSEQFTGLCPAKFESVV